MSGVGLGAAEILAQHWPADSGWFCRCGLELHFDPIAEAEHESSAERAFAAHQLDALKAAGYRVVPPGPQFVLEFDYRSDNGPHYVGPFPSREEAFEWAYNDVGDGAASYHAYPITAPDAAGADR